MADINEFRKMSHKKLFDEIDVGSIDRENRTKAALAMLNLKNTEEITNSVNKFSRKSSRQTTWIIILTIAMIALVITQVLLLIYQIFFK